MRLFNSTLGLFIEQVTSDLCYLFRCCLIAQRTSINIQRGNPLLGWYIRIVLFFLSHH